MSRRSNDDRPPYSRLFIVCSKDVTNDDLRSTFDIYGDLTEAKIIKDHKTDESKGVGYVTYKLTSQAARAFEELNGKYLCNKALKVLVASTNKNDEGDDDDEKYRRLFIVVPRNVNESDIRETFSVYGKVEEVTIPVDRQTNERKGVAFVKFSKFSECALAYEKVDSKYKAIFAQPKRAKPEVDTNFMPQTLMPRHDNRATLLKVLTHPSISQQQIGRLFDVLPGLEMCHLESRTEYGNEFIVRYSNFESATRAREKLHRFEYPPTMPIYVEVLPAFKNRFPQNYDRFDQSKSGKLEQLLATIAETASALSSSNQNMRGPSTSKIDAALKNLIDIAGSLNNPSNVNTDKDAPICDVDLPPPKPILDIDTPPKKRCFIVFNPHPPPITTLRDVFCRFGDMIDVFTMPHKNFGYVKYASERAANEAIKTLHGAQICGARMKVIEAEERRERPSSESEEVTIKRPKIQE